MSILDDETQEREKLDTTRPLPIHIASLDDVVSFIDNMADDIFSPLEGVELKKDEEAPKELTDIVNLYRVSIDDFVSQVSNLDYKPGFFRRIWYQHKERKAKKKLEILARTLKRYPDLKPVSEIIYKLDLIGKGNRNSKIQNKYARYLLANKITSSFLRTLHKKRIFDGVVAGSIYDSYGFTWIRYSFFRPITIMTAAFLFGTILFGVGYNAFKYKTERELNRKLMHDYSVQSALVIDEIRSFKENFVVDSEVRDEFYLCFAEKDKEIEVRRIYYRNMHYLVINLPDFRECFKELKENIGKKYDGKYQDDLKILTENYLSFIQQMSAKLMFLKGVQQDLRGEKESTNFYEKYTKNYFEKYFGPMFEPEDQEKVKKHWERWKMHFTVETAPLQYFSLVLSLLEQQELSKKGKFRNYGQEAAYTELKKSVLQFFYGYLLGMEKGSINRLSDTYVDDDFQKYSQITMGLKGGHLI